MWKRQRSFRETRALLRWMRTQSLLAALFITSVICTFQDRSLEIVTPKSLVSVTTFMHSPPITTGRRELMTNWIKRNVKLLTFVRGNKMSVFIRVAKDCCFSLFCSHPGSSAVTCTIISFCIRSSSERTSLESKPIASRVWRCSFFISSQPSSPKEDEIYPLKVHLFQLTSLQTIYPAWEPGKSVKAS